MACVLGTKSVGRCADRALVHRLVFQALCLRRIVQIVSQVLGYRPIVQTVSLLGGPMNDECVASESYLLCLLSPLEHT